MNRGRILPTGSLSGHNHTIESLADVNAPAPQEGDILMFVMGAWRLSSLQDLKDALDNLPG